MTRPHTKLFACLGALLCGFANAQDRIVPFNTNDAGVDIAENETSLDSVTITHPRTLAVGGRLG